MIVEPFVVRDSKVATEPQQREFLTSDDRSFFGKGTLCPKRKPVRSLKQDVNPLWIVNEFFFSVFVRASHVRMPDSDWCISNGEYYFVSEMLTNRTPLDSCDRLPPQFDNNRSVLTRGVLLDLALLNGDRTYGNILCDSEDLLWLNDHDKSLWGDGRPHHKDEYGETLEDEYGKTGDMDRYNSETLDKKFEDYIGDYLNARFNVTNQLVFTTQSWETVQTEFKSLALDVSHLAEARSQLPVANWLSDELYFRMETFLPLWWKHLDEFFSSQPDSSKLIQILNSRYEKHLAERSK